MKNIFFTNVPEPDEAYILSVKQKLFQKKVVYVNWIKYLFICIFVLFVGVVWYSSADKQPITVFNKVEALEKIQVTMKKYYDPTKLNYSKIRTTEYDAQGNIASWNVAEFWVNECGGGGSVGVTTYADTKKYFYNNRERYITYNVKENEINNEYMYPSIQSDNLEPYCYKVQMTIDWYKSMRYNDEEPVVSIVNKNGKEVILLELVYRNASESLHKDTRIKYYYVADSYVPYFTEYYDYNDGVYTLYKTESYEGMETLEPTNENLNSHLTMDLFWPKQLPKDVQIYEVTNTIQEGIVRKKVSQLRVAKPDYKYNFVPLSPAPTEEVYPSL